MNVLPIFYCALFYGKVGDDAWKELDSDFMIDLLFYKLKEKII